MSLIQVFWKENQLFYVVIGIYYISIPFFFYFDHLFDSNFFFLFYWHMFVLISPARHAFCYAFKGRGRRVINFSTTSNTTNMV